MLKRREFPESVTKRLGQALEQAGGTPPEDGPDANGTSSNGESETLASSEQRDENESVADLPTPDRTTTQVSRIIGIPSWRSRSKNSMTIPAKSATSGGGVDPLQGALKLIISIH